jgi:hypothetical protein
MSTDLLAAVSYDAASLGYPLLFGLVLLGSVVPVVPTGLVVGSAAALATTTDRLEGDGERLDGLPESRRHQCDDEAGVKSTTQHRPEGHVARQSESHRLVQHIQKSLGVVLHPQCRRAGGGQRILPPLLYVMPSTICNEPMARR